MEKPVPVVKVEGIQTQSKIDQMWQDALVTFKSLTGKNLQDVAPASPEELRKIIEARAKEQDTEEFKNRSKARERGLRILACINKFGEAAVQGVSTVFGGADICFKGLSLLLELPKKMKEFHEVVDKIFIRIAPVLQGFKVYARGEQIQAMDEDLIISIHKVMIALVTICATALNIEHARKWERFKNFTKRALCDDTELDEELEKFQMLVEGQQHVQGAVTLVELLDVKATVVANLKVTNEINSDIKGIKDRVQKKEAESSKQTLLTKIKSALGIDPKDPDTSKATFEDYLKKRAPGTGSWFKPMTDYQGWIDTNASAQEISSFLLLTGGQGFGKSFSVASIIDDLKQRTSTPAAITQTHRSLIGFYFFPARSGKAGDEQYPVEMALKSIAIQLAEQDEVYAKSIGELDQLKDAKPSKLWDALRLGSPMPRTTHFILLDALDNLLPPEQDELLKVFQAVPRTGTNGSSIRVLATGASSIFEVFQATENLSVREVKADRTRMESEFRHYIRHRLQAPIMLPGPDLSEKREGIENKIMHSECSFQTIQATLGAAESYIASSKSDEELNKLLDDSTRDTSVLLVDTVEKLQAGLDVGQIGWVNELLMWVLFGEQSLTIPQLEAAFFLRGKSLPIQGLENFINSRLKKLITSGPQGISPVDDNLDKVITKPRELSQGGPDNKTISLEIKINNASISTVQRFLWDLTKFSTLDGFSFKADDAAAQIAQSRGIIRVNKTDASLAIVESFFKFLKDDPSEKSESIRQYLIDYLADHLRTLRTAEGDNKLTPSEAGSIGKRIFELFDYPDASLKKHWDFFNSNWEFIEERNMSEFWEWIQMDTTLAELSGKERDHIVELKKDVRWERKLLKPTMKMVAKMWLRERGNAVYYLLAWIKRALIRIEDNRAATKASKSPETTSLSSTAKPPATAGPLTPSETATSNTDTPASTADYDVPDRPASPSPSSTSTEEEFDPPVKVDITEAASWCQEILELKDEELDSLWYERLGQTYKDSYPVSFKDAIEQYRKAEKCSSPYPSWEVLIGLSYSLLAVSSANFDEARVIHDRAMNLYKDSPFVSIEQKVSQLKDLAWWYDNYKEPEKALEVLEEVLVLAPEHGEAQYDIMSLLIKLEREGELHELVSKTAASKEAAGKEADKGLTPLGSLVKAVAMSNAWSRVDPLFWRIISILEATGSVEDLMGALDAGISLSKGDKENEYLQSVLITYKGMVHMHRSGSEDIHHVMECCKLARKLAHERLSRTMPWCSDWIYGKTTVLADRFHFNQASGRGRLPGSTALTTEDHVEALRKSMTEFEKSLRDRFDVRLSIAKSYLAAYYALKSPQNLEESRRVFASDMVRVTNMLSDGNKHNDADSLRQLGAILLHTGNVQNSLACMRLVPPDITNGSAASTAKVLTRLLCPEGGPPKEGSVAHRVLSSFDSNSKNMLYIRSDMIKTVNDLMDKLIDGRSASLAEAQKEKEEEDVDATLARLRTVRDALHIYGYRDCEGCIGSNGRTWDFENDFYACRYCYDLFLCGPCLDALKKADPNKPQPFCSPGHDWVWLPKWTVESWIEGFEGKVRVPKWEEGEKTGGCWVEGDEVVAFGKWLEGVLKPWGIGKEWEAEVKWDVERGEESFVDEMLYDGLLKAGLEAQAEEEKEKGEKEGGVSGEKVDGVANGGKMTVGTVMMEKVAVEKVAVQEVTEKS
ncbi:Putative protein of unknown function [Podospora comata]|uniref:Fungal STAND N-terminal Goodbye domain-containing protein n=1 Tax=Podospora comata TaxID=48703 RepID=A0ABY6SKW7_PODCO|nr:Putative protein of unknown function [Podospora comata]